MTITQTAYDFANAKYSGATLNFGNVHQGGSVASQSVPFSNPAVVNAAYQDSLNVSATASNSQVTPTGFTGLAASAGGATTSSLSFAVSTSNLGSLASTVALTLVSSANGVSGLANGTAAVVGTPGAITTTGQVYSGQSTWAGGSGTWGTLTSGFGTYWGPNQGSPGLDSGFASVDTATFPAAVSAGTVSLAGANPSLAAITFSDAGTSYTLQQGGGGALTLSNTSGLAPVSVTGVQSISAPINLSSSASVSTVNAADSLAISGAISGNGGLKMTGPGTLTLSASNGYSGGTTLTGGMLVLANAASSSLGAGPVLVSGGTLDASQYAQSINALTMTSLGSLNLSVTNTLTTSTAHFDGTLNLFNLGSLSGGTTDLISYGSSSGSFNSYTPLPSGYSLVYNLGQLDIVPSSVPSFSGWGVWNGTQATGGTGAWSNARNWADGAGNPGVPGGPGRTGNTDTATFSGTDAAPSITLDVPVSLAALSFSTSSYTLTDSAGTNGLTLNSASGTATVSVNGGVQTVNSAVVISGGSLTVVTANSGALALNGNISDDGGRSLTLTGDPNGQLVLSGSNTYTGGTFVEQGTLTVSTTASLPANYDLSVGALGDFTFAPTMSALSSGNRLGGGCGSSDYASADQSGARAGHRCTLASGPVQCGPLSPL